MPHDPKARKEAAALPLVLFGEHGRTVEGYRPADEDLAHARPAEPLNQWVPVQGPHLRTVRTKFKRNKSGIVGISFSRGKSGRRVYVQLGKNNRCFNIDRLGFEEAMRRAIELRQAHERKIAQANTAILAARSRYRFQHTEGAS